MVAFLNQSLSLPLLENGDRLTRAEFEHRYQTMPHHHKTELIEGRVLWHLASVVRARKHGKPHAAILAWLSDYWVATPGIELMDNPTVRLDADNEPQPDVCLQIEESIGDNLASRRMIILRARQN